MKHIHLHEIEVHAKESFAASCAKLAKAAHSRAVGLSRKYCHLVYFYGVFLEGHGVYAYAGGALGVLCTIAVLAGEEEEGM